MGFYLLELGSKSNSDNKKNIAQTHISIAFWSLRLSLLKFNYQKHRNNPRSLGASINTGLVLAALRLMGDVQEVLHV